MQTAGSQADNLWSLIIVIGASFMCILASGGIASAGFTNSAHGDTDGVNRSGTGYPIGSCAHCHDTFNDSICGVNMLMLFAADLDYDSQWDNFCLLSCHRDPAATEQKQVNMPNQYTYSVNRGGAPTGCPENVRESFRFVEENGQQRDQCGSTEGSSHFLDGIRSALAGKWGFDSDPANINACHACHNPHLAKQDYPCSLPSDHGNASGWEVWGDEPGEKMSDYATGGYYLNYYPPYLYPFIPGTPPVGLPPPQPSEWASDSTAPDYVTLCLECHQDPQDSTRLGRPLLAIDWSSNTISGGCTDGDRHGKKGEPGDAACYYGFCIYPYGSDCLGTSTEYKVVMCTDCHDPHGSPNEFLLRTCVNGHDGLTVPGPGEWWDFCRACHYLEYNPGYHSSSLTCPNCHGHGKCTNAGTQSEGF
jgi:hypothetical protein